MRLIVSNTGPLLHLAEASALHLFPLAGEIHVPPAVLAEVQRYAAGRFADQPSWRLLAVLTDSEASRAMEWVQAGLLDAGEAEAIVLAQRYPADWFLTDDAAARLFAESLGLEAHGSLGILLWAAAAQHISRGAAMNLLQALAGSSLWISAAILAEATNALNDLAAD